jgi:glycosyltransferase involved in cell wall biosynthesis
MMALRKPDICYLREDLLYYYQSGVPVINANTKNVKDVLKDLIENRDKWKEIGEQGRLYVEHVHDAKKVARKAIETYEKAT